MRKIPRHRSWESLNKFLRTLQNETKVCLHGSKQPKGTGPDLVLNQYGSCGAPDHHHHTASADQQHRVSLTKETCGLTRSCSHCNFQDFHSFGLESPVSLLKDPDSSGTSTDREVGVVGDPEEGAPEMVTKLPTEPERPIFFQCWC